MAIEHDAIADGERHEPKGISGASSNEAYLADGVGSGAWSDPLDGITYAYGGVSGKDLALAIATIGTTAKKLEAFDTNSPALGVTPDHTTDDLTIGDSGDYLVGFNISFSTSAGADAGIYQFRINVNGVESALGCRVEMSGTSDLTTVSCSGILTLTAAQVVTVYVESDEAGDTDDIVVEDVALTATLIKAS